MGVYPTFEEIPFMDDTAENQYTFYQWALLIIEAMNVASWIASLVSVKKTFSIFNKSEYDLIRNNFTHNFYNLQRDSEA